MASRFTLTLLKGHFKKYGCLLFFYLAIALYMVDTCLNLISSLNYLRLRMTILPIGMGTRGYRTYVGRVCAYFVSIGSTHTQPVKSCVRHKIAFSHGYTHT
jgi:hypothetical protein